MTVHIVSVSELRQQIKRLLANLESGGDPYFITQYSRPKAVLMRYQVYNDLMDRVVEEHPRIVRQPDISDGEPVIRGSRVLVRQIVERTAAGQTIRDIQLALPHLSDSQIYDALSYYHDHQVAIDEAIANSQLGAVVSATGLQVENLGGGIGVARAATVQ